VCVPLHLPQLPMILLPCGMARDATRDHCCPHTEAINNCGLHCIYQMEQQILVQVFRRAGLPELHSARERLQGVVHLPLRSILANAAVCLQPSHCPVQAIGVHPRAAAGPFSSMPPFHRFVSCAAEGEGMAGIRVITKATDRIAKFRDAKKMVHASCEAARQASRARLLAILSARPVLSRLLKIHFVIVSR